MNANQDAVPRAVPAEFSGPVVLFWWVSGACWEKGEEEENGKKGGGSRRGGTNLNSLVELGTLYPADDLVAGYQFMTSCFTRGLALDGEDEARVPFGKVGEVEELLPESGSVLHFQD